MKLFVGFCGGIVLAVFLSIVTAAAFADVRIGWPATLLGSLVVCVSIALVARSITRAVANVLFIDATGCFFALVSYLCVTVLGSHGHLGFPGSLFAFILSLMGATFALVGVHLRRRATT